MMTASPDHKASVWRWTLAVIIVCAPLLASICVDLWRTPMPVSEAVALFEDIARQPPSRFLVPDTSYYRPLYQLTLGTIWRHGGSLEQRLAWVKLMQIVPFLLLVLLLILYLRPRGLMEAAAAIVAVAVLLGSPGLRDNLEIPLSYTIVGMPVALMGWMLLNRERRTWHAPAFVVLALLAIGFKEQGLVLIPLAVVAWWMGAPSARRGLVLTLVVLAVAYVALRLNWREKWPMFEQAVGLGFTEMEPSEAVVRFGAFPYWMYAYSAGSTVLNILFSEPTRGTFRIIRDIRNGHPQLWELNHLISAVALTGVIFWWGIGSLRRAWREGWSQESRVFVAMLTAVLVCGVLSFNYSRDRLGGMAAVFYAIAAFFALRALATAALEAVRGGAAALRAGYRAIAVGMVLMLVSATWHIRALSTAEYVRLTSFRNQVGWLVELEKRRLEFADRDVYRQIMESMVEQGTVSGAPRPTRYPRRIAALLALP